ncbi:SAM-dependent methyltransferase [Roseofilum casamattae]|uniref:S-adenosyl-L-methionine-dependent methyltransferase n=1 Tax=Roseofilum casamattae BLCC-M143 TaxID=3022442 RepID=A0ABT7BUT5_9CYAN|nr:SAM-dependent methyltransferase [Roseofilum casamattae]MDJ1182941.1 SAM-dependent methyltransferase [Roseofilum casamattae BLCC-M143]
MTVPSPTPENFVPFTARVMAAIRDLESQRDDRLFNDPYARQFVTPEAIAFRDRKLQDIDRQYLALRTRFFDDFLRSLSPRIRQIVFLGAGMDARAYRLPWPENTALYELDLAEIIDAKADYFQNISPQLQRIAIAADLTQPWISLLCDRGYQKDAPTLWILEGLLMYLSNHEVEQLLQDISDLSQPESAIGFDIVSSASLDYEPYRGHFKSGYDRPLDLLSSYGWQGTLVEPSDLSIRLGRPPLIMPPELPENSRSWFVTGIKQ